MSPTYDELCAEFGFRVPQAYHRFLMLADELSPASPRDAFDPLDIYYLDDRGPEAVSYTAPPEFFIFAWTGTGSGSYGFVVDEPVDNDERPIAEWYPDGCHRGIIASNFADFLSLHFAPYDEQELRKGKDASHRDEIRQRLRSAISERYGLRIPETQHFATTLAANERFCAGAVPTEDRIGVLLPENTVDRRYLGSLSWPSVSDWQPKRAPDERLFDEAEKRLMKGEPGTALVLARNIRFHFWYDDWKTSRAIIRRTCDVMSQAYEQLGRQFAAKRIRNQTTNALEQVS